jgi:hypothetical protein
MYVDNAPTTCRVWAACAALHTSAPDGLLKDGKPPLQGETKFSGT